jgi:hypothetical protein
MNAFEHVSASALLTFRLLPARLAADIAIPAAEC